MVAGDEPSDDHVSRVSVETLPEGGVRIDDRIDRRNYTVRTGGDVSPEAVDGERFRYPTDVAVAIRTDHLEFVPTGASFVHESGDMTEVELFDRETFPAGEYTVELSGPLKLYANLEGPCEVEKRAKNLTVDLPAPETVVVGARSLHERPATTLTTTEEPADVMRAVSTFGNELKTLGSKRSYPTLRGHPPALEVGDELSVPPGLEPPEENVHLEVPPTLEYVLPAAPLSYYLGAGIRAGESPALVVDGTRHRLDRGDGFERTVERTLKRTFFLDCLVRTESPREVVLYERAELDDALDVDLRALYGRPAAERLEAYQSVPYEAVEPYLPDWRRTAHVQPTRMGIEALPFLANDLAAVRVHEGPPTEGGATPPTPDVSGPERGLERSTAPGEVVRPPETDSVAQAWVGPGVPVGAIKTIPQAFRNWQRRERRDDEEVAVAVVCNDESMLEEGTTARDAYGSNLNLPFDVTFHDNLDTEELRLVFESDLDYVHYVGHVREDGFECADGTLDVAPLETVGVDIAFLNACDSYRQGEALIEKGAVASVVTFDEVLDDGALRIGKTMARLLNRGFPLDGALSVARARSIVGSQYLVLGDGNADIAQAKGLIPWVAEAESIGQDEYRLQVTAHPTRNSEMGSQFRPAVGDDRPVFLIPKDLPAVTATDDRLREYLESASFPVFIDGEFAWSSDAAGEL
jgi:hypothetical protein